MVAQSAGSLVYQASKQTSHASTTCLYVSLQQCRHSLLGHKELRSTGTANEHENYKYKDMHDRLQFLSNNTYLRVTHTLCK